MRVRVGGEGQVLEHAEDDEPHRHGQENWDEHKVDGLTCEELTCVEQQNSCYLDPAPVQAHHDEEQDSEQDEEHRDYDSPSAVPLPSVCVVHQQKHASSKEQDTADHNCAGGHDPGHELHEDHPDDAYGQCDEEADPDDVVGVEEPPLLPQTSIFD